ncbi:MAG: VWA domain-containing protein [Verrucomicrobiales bacterium]|nr:VWA domain-containing protein [Verrucomicrobiales bacterium]
MNDLLLKLLGVRTDGSASVVDWGLEVQPVVGRGWLILVVAALVCVAYLSYRRRDVELTSRRRRWLLGLRWAAMILLVGILLRPGLGLTVEGLVRQSLILLFDQSASMTLRDPRVDPADQSRAALAQGRLPAAGGLGQAPRPEGGQPPSRLELVSAILTNRELALVEQLSRSFDIKPVGFAGDLIPLPLSLAPTNAAGLSMASDSGKAGSRMTGSAMAPALRAQGRQTAPGTALRELAERERGRAMAGVVLFTDGIRNAGGDPRAAASRLREAGWAVHVVGAGTVAPRDLQLVDLVAPEVVFARDEVSVVARVRSRGLAGQTAQVSLTLDGQRVDERELRFDADGETQVTVKATPEQPGDFELAVEVPVRPDEILSENNRQVRRLRVMDDKVKVLLLEESPRWEFRYLQALLLRDRRVELKCVLFDGDPAITRSPGSPYLDAFPNRREDLFSYDLVIFGDVDPRHFTPTQLEILSDFVARSGGSFLMVAGRRFSPWSYRDTPLERVLPVEFDRPLASPAATSVHERPLKPALTPEGRTSPLLRLSEDPEENQHKWEALPPLFWTAPVRRAKPAAQVLATVALTGETDPPIPLIALQQYGVGQSMFIGTDNTWRWRRNEGEQFHVAFWGRVVQRMAILHLLSGSRRTQLVLDRLTAVPGERIGVTARLFTSAFEPLADAIVRGRLERGSGAGTNLLALAGGESGSEVLLRAVPDQPGLYQGEWVAPSPGRYRLRVGEDAQAAVDFSVEDRLVESGETAMQETDLREWATAGGGEFFREEDLHRLPTAVKRRALPVRSRMTVELWSSPLYYLAILVLFATEWVMRKLWQLK